MKPHLRTLVWGTTAALYFVATTLAHLAFSLWLVAQRTTTWQGNTYPYSYRDALPWLLPVAALALLGWLVHNALRHGTPRRIGIVLVYWVIWLACIVGVDRWLTYSIAEYFHYPQYALLAILLAKTMDPTHARWPITRLLLITTLLGALDELAQYMWITVSYSNYYDFNDVLVNLLAATLGMMVYYGLRTPPTPMRRSSHRLMVDPINSALLTFIFLGCALAWATGHLGVSPPAQVPPGGIFTTTEGVSALFLERQAGLYGGWQPGIRHGQYHVLTPIHGMSLVTLVLLLWAFWRCPPLLKRGRSRQTAAQSRHEHIRQCGQDHHRAANAPFFLRNSASQTYARHTTPFFRSIRAGTPTYVPGSHISEMTTVPAPTTIPPPTQTLSITTAPAPSMTCRPI